MFSVYLTKLNPNAFIPHRKTPSPAGSDLYAPSEVVIHARCRKLIPIGVAVKQPPSTYGRIASRSGLSLKHGIEVGAGVIDVDYVGEIELILYNHSDVDVKLSAGKAIAQLVIEPVVYVNFVEATSLPNTIRGQSGFGPYSLS